MWTRLKYCTEMLQDNEDKVRKEAEVVLLKICNNILKNPQESKYRKLNLSNATVSTKLFPAAGAIECLFEVGFLENGDEFLLPIDHSLEGVRQLHKHLNDKLTKNSSLPSTSPCNILQPSSSSQVAAATAQEYRKKSFFEKLIGQFQQVLRYEDSDLQSKVKSILPLEKLQIQAIKKLRDIQREIKAKSAENDVVIEDLLLAELLDWFKNKFFKWFDSPACNNCMGDCSYEQSVASSNPQISRIEIYKCKSCGYKNQFPRYTDPEPLLYTRRGRCGEWANTFTLICRTVGFDARLIYDETDHVWTEVWSDAHQRWIHADACENVMDSPLMYEKGWGKKLSYVIAFSKDEIQDVTWRYVRNLKEVRKRRSHCSEGALVIFINKLNLERQNGDKYSVARKKYVAKRTAIELAEMLTAPPGCTKPCEESDNASEYRGRTSGSLAWRISRGEINNVEYQPFQWIIPRGVSSYELAYSINNDAYTSKNISNDKIIETKKNWLNGIEQLKGKVFRKEEQDWKMVYLARSPESTTSKITWTFVVEDETKCIDSLEYQVSTTTFHEAVVKWEVEGVLHSNDQKLKFVSGSDKYNSKDLKGAIKMSLSATFSGGTGDMAWQHAQLFRQSLDSKDIPMIIRISLIDRS